MTVVASQRLDKWFALGYVFQDIQTGPVLDLLIVGCQYLIEHCWEHDFGKVIHVSDIPSSSVKFAIHIRIDLEVMFRLFLLITALGVAAQTPDRLCIPGVAFGLTPDYGYVACYVLRHWFIFNS